jgi:hypothetical protein
MMYGVLFFAVIFYIHLRQKRYTNPLLCTGRVDNSLELIKKTTAVRDSGSCGIPLAERALLSGGSDVF